jgi:hypothetical protein
VELHTLYTKLAMQQTHTIHGEAKHDSSNTARTDNGNVTTAAVKSVCQPKQTGCKVVLLLNSDML